MSLRSRMQIPIWGESTVALERAALLRDPVFRGEGVTRGDGRPVLLIPGFLAGDTSLGLMARWLKAIGYRPVRAGIRANVDCTEATLRRLAELLEAAHAVDARPVSIVGQSRGGTMARALAVRRPDLVRSIVTLGSPLVDQFDVHPFVRGQLRLVATLGSLGVPGLLAHRCREGCCVDALADVAAPFPDGVGFRSVYSRRDGIVDWRACLDLHAEHVEVRASHIGMAVNAAVYRAVGEALAAHQPADGLEPLAVAV